MSFLFSGGGIAKGQVIGATDGRGEHPVSRRVGVGDFLATIYRRLGIDSECARVREPAGRPVPLLQQEGAPVRIARSSELRVGQPAHQQRMRCALLTPDAQPI